MALSPLAGKPAPRRCWSISRGWNGTISSAGRIRTIPPSRSASGPAGTAEHPCAARSTSRTSWRSPRRSATIGMSRRSPVRSTWARTRTRSRGRRSARRSRCWRPTTCRPSSSATTASRRRRSISHAILVHNRGRSDGLADGIVITPSHNPPEDGGFKYNPPNGGPADTDVTKWIEARANALLRDGNAGVKRLPLQAAISSETTHQRDLMRPYVEDLRNVIDMDAIRGAKLALGGRPARRRRRGLLGPDQFDLRPRHRGHQSSDRSVLLVHDRRPRRRHPDGLLEPLCDGPARRPQGPLSGRVRQRPGLRSAWHRHADGGIDESQPLPGGGDRLSADAPARLAGGRRGWEDRGQQRHDRSRREQAGPPAVRSARGLQVVCACIVRQLVLLRRRGERRRQLPAPRRQRMDDRQGRTDHEPAGRRDHRAHRPGSGRALHRAHGANSVRPTTPASTHRRRRNRRRSWRGSRPNRSRPRAWPANRSC